MASSNVNVPMPPEVNPPVPEKWGYTQVKVDEFSYMWAISNFSLCSVKTGYAMSSPIFTGGINGEFKWCIDMYPHGITEDSKDHLSIYLRLLECNKPEVRVDLFFTTRDRNMKKSQSTHVVNYHTFFMGTSLGYPKFISRDSLMNRKNDLLPDDKLTVCCEISIIAEISSVPGKTVRFNNAHKIPKCRALDDFGSLLDSEKFSDVTLAVGDTEFRAHKAILSSRSLVFSAMFELDMTESKENRVVISGMDAEVFDQMLEFIYTGRAKNVKAMADGLLAAADKYDLERLKALSESVLCNNLAIENAADCLMLADLHCAQRLKAQAIDFINVHAKDVMETTSYKSMVAAKPCLIDELFRASVLGQSGETDVSSEIQRKKLRL